MRRAAGASLIPHVMHLGMRTLAANVEAFCLMTKKVEDGGND